jgi:hypothetical protein
MSEFHDGIRHGPFTDHAIKSGEFLDARIIRVTGRLNREVPVDVWEFRDDEGTLLKRIDLGVLPDEVTLQHCALFSDVEVPAQGTWDDEAAGLMAQRQIGAALCALAREAARSGSAERLQAALSERTCALSLQHSTRLLKLQRGAWLSLVHALAQGAEPSDALRALAAGIPFAKRAARDFIEAALLLTPEGLRADLSLARALNRLEFGDLEGAVSEADRLAEQDEVASRFVRDLSGVLFSEFRFITLDSDLPEAPFEELPTGPAQPLAAVNTAISKSALRLTQIRTALQRLYTASSLGAVVLPPDVSHLVQSDVVLGQWQFEIDEEGEAVSISVDERLVVNPQSAVALLSRAHVEWMTLCVLCWGSGLREVAQPSALDPPTNFNQALGQAVQRYWRCKDQATTSGLLARRQGVPGFRWRQFDITALTGPLLQLASNEYLEQRAILFWLADAQCQSPWQDDLRPA